MEYQELKDGIKRHLNSAAEDFFMVGYCLRQISESALFLEDGYKSIWEFAKSEYGLSTSSASRFMAINARFSIDGGEHMAEKYIGMGVSKLQEMLGLPDEELEKITKETTVREIRAMKKKQEEPLSFFGFPKTVRPEGSLLTTPGCGDGKYDCFSCSRECGIRQEARQCRVSTCGNPKPCVIIDNYGEWKKNIRFSMYRNTCQMLHHELAPTRAGDGEPDPCCLTCDHQTCFNRCDVAKQRDDEKKKQAAKELREAQKAKEMKKPEPSEPDIRAFMKWSDIRPGDAITAEGLKNKYSHSGGGGGSELRDYRGSARGMRLNYKREITWAQLAKRIKELQTKDAAELKAAGMDEKEILADFYLTELPPGIRAMIANRDKAAVTKTLKEEYGGTFENGRMGSGVTYSCYPDKINFIKAPGSEPLQITWGRFVTRLLRVLDEHPEIERAGLNFDKKAEEAAARSQETEKEPDIIDADFKEAPVEKEEPQAIGQQEPEDEDELLCDDCANASTLTGNTDLCANCGPSGIYYKPLADPQTYTDFDVSLLLDESKRELQQYLEVNGLPEATIRRRRIIVDALQLLHSKMMDGRE